MTERSTSPLPLFAGVLFCLMALGWLVALDYSFSVLAILCAGGCVVSAVALFRRQRDCLLLIGIAILTGAVLLGTLDSMYQVILWHYHSVQYVVCLLLARLALLAGYFFMVLLCLALSTQALAEYRGLFARLWFLPAACMVAAMVLSLITFYASGTVALQTLATGIAFLLTGLWLARPDTLARTRPEVPGCYPLLPHILLLLFTLGIWYFVWVYRQTRFLNQAAEEPPRNPAAEVLLCLFIPLYYVFWTYKSARRLLELSQEAEVRCESPVLFVALALWGWFLSPIFLQDQINLTARKRTPPPPQAALSKPEAPAAEAEAIEPEPQE